MEEMLEVGLTSNLTSLVVDTGYGWLRGYGGSGTEAQTKARAVQCEQSKETKLSGQNYK